MLSEYNPLLCHCFVSFNFLPLPNCCLGAILPSCHRHCVVTMQLCMQSWAKWRSRFRIGCHFATDLIIACNTCVTMEALVPPCVHCPCLISKFSQFLLLLFSSSGYLQQRWTIGSSTRPNPVSVILCRLQYLYRCTGFDHLDIGLFQVKSRILLITFYLWPLCNDVTQSYSDDGIIATYRFGHMAHIGQMHSLLWTPMRLLSTLTSCA